MTTEEYLVSIGLNPSPTHGGLLRSAAGVLDRWDPSEDEGQEFETDDPVEWCEHRGAFLWSAQKRVMRAVASEKKICVPAGNSVGKTHLSAWITRWWTSEPDSRVVTTANTGYQVKNNTWHEIGILADKFNWTPRPKVMQWDISAHQQAIGLATDKIEAFQGLHAPRLLVIVDEASGDRIDKIYIAIERLASDFDATILLLGNLTRRVGVFAEASKGKMGYTVIRVTGEEAADWQTEHGRIPGLVDQRKVDEWKDEHGEDSDFYRVAVKAELPEGDAAGLFPPRLIDSSLEKEVTPTGPWRIGIDVARGGGDQTVIVGRRGNWMKVLWKKKVKDHMITFDWFMKWMEEQDERWTDWQESNPDIESEDYAEVYQVAVDSTGEGSALADVMRREGMPIVREHFGGGAKKKKRFKNRRAEGYFALKSWMGNGGRIPDDRQLIEELEYQEPESVIGVEGARVWKLLPKDEIKERLGRSPDVSDACVLTVMPSKKGRPNISQL